MALTDTDINLIDTLTTKSNQAGINLLKDFPEIRSESLDALKESGLPGNKHEEYKYFNVSRKIKRDYNLDLSQSIEVEPEWIKSKLVEDENGIHIVFLNGILLREFSKINNSIDGFEFFSLGDMASNVIKIL